MLRRVGDYILAFVRGFVLFMTAILGGCIMTYVLQNTVFNAAFWNRAASLVIGVIQALPILVLYAIPGLAATWLLKAMFGQDDSPNVHRGREFGSRADAQKELREILKRQRSKQRDRRSRFGRLWRRLRKWLPRLLKGDDDV